MIGMHKVPGNKPSERCVDESSVAGTGLGEDIKIKHFNLKPGLAYFNHGSYGAVPRPVLELQNQYNWEREEHPDLWYRINAKNYVDRARQAVADFVGADLEGVQLVMNATTAINCTVRSFPFSAGDGLLHCNYTYGAIANLCEDFTSRIRPDVENVWMKLPFPPTSDDELVRHYEKILDKHPNIKLAIIDHISSPTSIIMPVKRLVDLCHSRGVKVIIDGAHCLGQLPLNLRELGADIYTANAHKWLFSPRGSALLYVSESAHAWVQPPSTSWQIGKALEQQFYDQGTRDHIPVICVKHGLEFYQACGGMDKVVGYSRSMADKAVAALQKELGLKPLPLLKSMEAPNIRLVELPPLKDFPFSSDVMWDLHIAIFGESPCFMLVVPIEGKFYLRVITQIYTSDKDIEKLVNTLKVFFSKHPVADSH